MTGRTTDGDGQTDRRTDGHGAVDITLCVWCRMTGQRRRQRTVCLPSGTDRQTDRRTRGRSYNAVCMVQDDWAEKDAADRLPAEWDDVMLKSKNVDASLRIVKRKFTQVPLLSACRLKVRNVRWPRSRVPVQ